MAKHTWFKAAIQISIAFVLVNFAWIFFRAATLRDAYYIITHLFNNLTASVRGINLGLDFTEIIISIFFIILMECVQIVEERRGMQNFLSTKPRWLRWAFYITLVLLILLFGVFERRQFIYFQF